MIGKLSQFMPDIRCCLVVGGLSTKVCLAISCFFPMESLKAEFVSQPLLPTIMRMSCSISGARGSIEINA